MDMTRIIAACAPAFTLALVLQVGCTPAAHDVHARYPSLPTTGAEEAGRATLELRFTHAVSNAQLAVNGVPITSGVKTARIVVDDVPAGRTSIVLAADGEQSEKSFALELAPGAHVVVPLVAASEGSFARTMEQAFVAAVVWAVYLGVRSML